MKKLILITASMILVCLETLSGAALPRKVIVLYDGKVYSDTSHTKFHQVAEMPLNHLGLICDYHNIWEPLPNIVDQEDVIGVSTWLSEATVLPAEKAEAYLEWAIDVVSSGKKYVIFGNPSFESDKFPIDAEKLNKFWNLLGLFDTKEWEGEGYFVELIRHHPKMTDFERSYPIVPLGFRKMVPASENLTCYLSAKKKNEPEYHSCLVATSPSGGYAANNYAMYYQYEEGMESRKWYINPFLFFWEALGLKLYPIPDTTTLAGRRVYYSHIDGDGWYNRTEVDGFKRPNDLSSNVIIERIIKKNPDLPVTVGPIAADIDLDWVGTVQGRKIANEIFRFPQVEVGCHTLSHPFAWGFFEDYLPSDEYPYLHLYTSGSWLGRGIIARAKAFFNFRGNEGVLSEEAKLGQRGVKTFDKAYVVPRAFALQPFNLDLEVSGAIAKVNELSSKNKPVMIYQWSGDCEPFLAAVEAVERSGVLNINGGGTRFDGKYPSYSWVSPLTRQIKGKRQIYASNSNENTYTNYWRSDFYAFNQLPETLKNTESPIRVKPINLYYHIFSGEKTGGLAALEQNLKYIKSQKIIPIEASAFCSIVKGFFSTRIETAGGQEWIISNRGGLQTVRFDFSSEMEVDFSRSKGVIGQSVYKGSLYVALDHAVPEARIALRPNARPGRNPLSSEIYLIDSRWRVSDFNQNSQGASFKARGFGPGEMAWYVPNEGIYEVVVKGEAPESVQSRENILNFSLDFPAIQALDVEIRLKKSLHI